AVPGPPRSRSRRRYGDRGRGRPRGRRGSGSPSSRTAPSSRRRRASRGRCGRPPRAARDRRRSRGGRNARGSPPPRPWWGSSLRARLLGDVEDRDRASRVAAGAVEREGGHAILIARSALGVMVDPLDAGVDAKTILVRELDVGDADELARLRSVARCPLDVEAAEVAHVLAAGIFVGTMPRDLEPVRGRTGDERRRRERLDPFPRPGAAAAGAGRRRPPPPRRRRPAPPGPPPAPRPPP